MIGWVSFLNTYFYAHAAFIYATRFENKKLVLVFSFKTKKYTTNWLKTGGSCKVKQKLKKKFRSKRDHGPLSTGKLSSLQLKISSLSSSGNERVCGGSIQTL